MDRTSSAKLLAACLVLTGCAADEDQSGKSNPQQSINIAAERQASMVKLDRRMVSLDELIGAADTPKDFRQKLLEHARIVRALSQQITGDFSDDTPSDESRATQAVWDKRPEFEMAANDLFTKINSFVATAENADNATVVAAYRELNLADTCASCHETFRKNK